MRAPPHDICMPVLYLSLQQAIGSRCMGDWLGYKSPAQMEVGRALDRSWHFGYRWIWIVNWIWDCRCRCLCLWIIVVCLYYQLIDFTVHLLFLFTTLIFTTRLLSLLRSE